ncbi:MAG: hypothetical protein ACOX1Z_02650 [Candidatus Ratteibacteria bacterium]
MKRQIIVSIFIMSLLLSFAYSAPQKFECRILGDDVFLMTEGNTFLIQPISIICKENMLYFAAQDNTLKKEMVVNKAKEVKIVADENEKKHCESDLTCFQTLIKIRPLQIMSWLCSMRFNKDFRFLAIYSQFVYTGSGTNECAINWALDSVYEPYKYYTIPHKGKEVTF